MKKKLEIDFEKLRRELEQEAKRNPPTSHKWTSEEETILREFYGKVRTVTIARKLGRSIQSVNGHIDQMGLRSESDR